MGQLNQSSMRFRPIFGIGPLNLEATSLGPLVLDFNLSAYDALNAIHFAHHRCHKVGDLDMMCREVEESLQFHRLQEKTHSESLISYADLMTLHCILIPNQF